MSKQKQRKSFSAQDQGFAELLIGQKRMSWWRYLFEKREAVISYITCRHSRRKLTGESSKKAYENVWAGVQERCKEEFTTLHEAILFPSGHRKKMLLGGQLYDVKEQVYHDAWKRLFISVMRSYLLEEAPVIEMGCGYGRNLFILREEFSNHELYGCDITEQGIITARWLTDRFSVKDIKFEILDMTNFEQMVALRNRLGGKRPIVFTVASFEQIKYATAEALKGILGLNPLFVIHFEPVLEMHQSRWSWRDYLIRKRYLMWDYQASLYDSLKKLEEGSILRILEAHRLGFGDPFFEKTLLVWEPLLSKSAAMSF